MEGGLKTIILNVGVHTCHLLSMFLIEQSRCSDSTCTLTYMYFLFSSLLVSPGFRPLVAGTSESDQLDRIFRLLGTPSPQSYPDIVNLPEYSQDLPHYPPPRGGVASLVPSLDPQGLNLLEQMLQYDPSRRMSAQGALEHPFFSDLNAGSISVGGGTCSSGGAGANGSGGR